MAMSTCSVKEKKKNILDLTTPRCLREPLGLCMHCSLHLECPPLLHLEPYSFFKSLLRLHLLFKVFLPLPLLSLSAPSPDTYSRGLRNAGLLLNLVYVRGAWSLEPVSR